MKRQLTEQYNPVNCSNMVKLGSVPPWNPCNVQRLPQKKEFDSKYKILKTLLNRRNIQIVLIEDLNTKQYYIGKIYDCFNKDKKTMQKKFNKCYKEFQVVGQIGLMEYFKLYYDKTTHSLLILQALYKQSLSQYISNINISDNAPTDHEQHVKTIANDILKKLWRLHNSKYVHTDIKPDNIMERELDYLYQHPTLIDGWLLIDFQQVCKHNSKGHYKGTIGWSAPEIDINSNKNKYTYASDIFSFGLIILYLICGTQPLMLPLSDINKYKQRTIKNDNDKANLWANHYYKCVKNGENIIKHFLFGLYNKGKISDDLFRLLFEGILVYDAKKRLNCKQIYYSKWLADVNC